MRDVSRNGTRAVAGDDTAVRVRQVDQLCRFAGTLGAALDTSALIEDCQEPLLALSEAAGIMVALSGAEPRLFEHMTGRRIRFSGLGRGLPASAVAAMGTEARAFSGIGELPEALSSRLTGVGRGQVIVVPLWVHARLLGVVLLVREGRPCDVTTLKLLTAAGRQLALAVENSFLLGELEKSYGRLMDSQEELIRSERMAAMGEISATLAHEIRNPLATIFSAVSQIRKHARLDPVSSQLLDITEEETLRMNRMVGRLLEFARPRKPNPEPARPRAVVAAAVRSFIESGNVPRGVELVAVGGEDDPEAVFDADLLERAVSMLITNGLQAVEERGGEVRVGVEHDPAGRPGFVVTVSDSGCGIPMEHLHRVLEPFYSTRPAGIGLSLPTAMRIAEDHGGSIEIQTEVGTGTTVRMFIPQATPSAAKEKR